MKKKMNVSQEQGKTQAYNRKKNNALVLSILAQEPSSGTMLSSRLGLSNSALSGILGALRSMGVIAEEVRVSTSGRGRKQVRYCVNGNFGLIVVVAIANYQAKITVSNIKKETLAVTTVEVSRYDVQAVYDIVCSISSLVMEERFRPIPLKEIVICWPGRVNSQTGELAVSPQFDPDLFADKDFLVREFGKLFKEANIFVSNDIKFALLGEKQFGALQKVDNAMLLSLDNGIGGAMLLNGECFLGEQGYAGEFGLLKTNFEGKEMVLDEFASLRALKLHFKEKLGREIHTKDLVSLYQNDAEAKRYILSTARGVGRVLYSCSCLLDVTKILLSGRVKKFGEDYIKAIEGEFLDPCYAPDISYSQLEDAVSLGATSYGVSHALKDAIE